MDEEGFDLDDCFGPYEEHIHAFTWAHCFAQGEKGSRVYRFGIVGGEDWHFRVYCRRRGWKGGVWMSYDMSRSDSLELMSAVEGISVPLYFEAPQYNTTHVNNRFTVSRGGARLEIWWDSGGNPVVDAMEPVLPFLYKVQDALKDTFAAKDLKQSGDDSEL